MRRVVQYSQIDSIGVSGDKKGLHWYQWYDLYQWKSNLFQWFCRWICISLRGLWLFSDVVLLGTEQFQWPPLVPMVRLIPMEKHPIPMVLSVNMHLNHWNDILFYWYQSYHWYQWTIGLTNRIRLCILDMSIWAILLRNQNKEKLGLHQSIIVRNHRSKKLILNCHKKNRREDNEIEAMNYQVGSAKPHGL